VAAKRLVIFILWFSLRIHQTTGLRQVQGGRGPARDRFLRVGSVTRMWPLPVAERATVTRRPAPVRRAGFPCWHRARLRAARAETGASEHMAEDAEEDVNVQLLIGPVELGSQRQRERILQMSEDGLDLRLAVGRRQ